MLARGTRVVLVVDGMRGSATIFRPSGVMVDSTGDERVDLADVVEGWAPTAAELIGG